MINYSIYKTTERSLSAIRWGNIEAMQLLDNSNAGKAPFATTIKLAYNDDAIFFQFKAAEDKINCVMNGYNEPIYDEETVELFFSSGGDISRYLELEWNAIGGVFCAKVVNDMNGSTTLNYIEDNIIVSDIVIGNSEWTITGSLPRALFDGEFCGEWRFNAYRIKRREDNSMILMAFSPTFEEAFHRPNKFASLTFE